MRVEDMGYLPPVGGSEVEVNLGIYGCVDHGCHAIDPHEIGEAPLPCAAHLDDSHFAAWHWYLGAVPSQGPGLHTAFQRKGFVALGAQLLGGDSAGPACSADGHNGSVIRQLYACKSIGVAEFSDS